MREELQRARARVTVALVAEDDANRANDRPYLLGLEETGNGIETRRGAQSATDLMP
jgi:hypothetical protein